VINRHPIGYGVYHDTDGDECSYGMESGCGDYVDGDDYQKLVEAYDALLAERDALQQQVESLQNKWAQRPLSVADTAALEAENDALRAALTKYGRHTTECQQGNLPANLKRAYPCDCGYALVEGDKS
jgi:hypothetical protein